MEGFFRNPNENIGSKRTPRDQYKHNTKVKGYPSIYSSSHPSISFPFDQIKPLHYFPSNIHLNILDSWSPKSWSEYRWKNHLCSSLLQASTRMFEWLATHDLFCGSSFLEKRGLSCTCAIFLYVES